MTETHATWCTGRHTNFGDCVIRRRLSDEFAMDLIANPGDDQPGYVELDGVLDSAEAIDKAIAKLTELKALLGH